MPEIIQLPKKAGRPRKEINWEEFEKILLFLPTLPEVASYFGVSERTFQRAVHRQYKENYDTLLKRFGEKTKISLRRNLLKMSETNASAAIFLAKNLLGMRDQPEVTAQQVDGIILIDPDEQKEKQKESKE